MTMAMKTFIVLNVLLILLICLNVTAMAQDGLQTHAYSPVLVYDPNRDAAQDLRDAEAEAKRTGKNVLVEVGGNWCIWCLIMYKFFARHPKISDLRDKNFVTIAINFSRENENKEVLSQFPQIPAYPHLFVLNGNGELLRSQRARDLEERDSYDTREVERFLKRWSPKR